MQKCVIHVDVMLILAWLLVHGGYVAALDHVLAVFVDVKAVVTTTIQFQFHFNLTVQLQFDCATTIR